MKVSRTYEAQSLDSSFYQSIDTFIFGTVTDEERNRRLAGLWGGKKLPASYHLDYDLVLLAILFDELLLHNNQTKLTLK